MGKLKEHEMEMEYAVIIAASWARVYAGLIYGTLHLETRDVTIFFWR